MGFSAGFYQRTSNPIELYDMNSYYSEIPANKTMRAPMFKRVTAVLVVLTILLCCMWVYLWNEPESNGRGFFTRYPVLQPLHLSKDLSGLWGSYSSLNDAWHQEKQKLTAQETFLSSQDLSSSLSAVMALRQIILPSDEGFAVAAKRFQIQNQWSTKRIQLTIGGISGQAEVFLNGMDAAHRIGTLEGGGAVQTILVESARLDFAGENVLLIHMRPSIMQSNQVLGSWSGDRGMITGPLLLEALPEISVSWENLSAEYKADEQEIALLVDVTGAKEDGLTSWQLEGELVREDKTVVAKGSVAVRGGGESHQRLSLTLSVPQQMDLWSPDKPDLYDLRLLLSDGSGVLDSLQIPLGFAQPGLAADGSWTLNGEALPVQGIALTREQAAILQSANVVDDFLRDRKERGDTVIYLIDYIDEYWLNAADRLGLGVWCELPVVNTDSDHLTVSETLERLLCLGQRHPSLLAWTVLKGAESGDADRRVYLDTAARLAEPCLTYQIVFRTRTVTGSADSQTLTVSANKLSGVWGEIEAAAEADIRSLAVLMAADTTEGDALQSAAWAESVSGPGSVSGPESWSEKAAAPIFLVFLLFLEVKNFRMRGIPYAYLMTAKRLKRWANSACRMRFYTFAGGMAVLAALCLHVFLLIPTAANPWLEYPWGFLTRLQGMPPYLLWVTLWLLLIMLRLLQLGLASSGFKYSPDAIKLACWLEQQCGWRWIAAIGWLWVSWGGALWVALLFCLGLLLIALPSRFKTYRRIGAKIKYLWLLPVGIAVGVGILLLFHIRELVYCWKVFV